MVGHRTWDLKLTVEYRAVELLKSASKYGTNIKAIAVTGSVNAMTTGMDIADRTFNSSEWLPVSSPRPSNPSALIYMLTYHRSQSMMPSKPTIHTSPTASLKPSPKKPSGNMSRITNHLTPSRSSYRLSSSVLPSNQSRV